MNGTTINRDILGLKNYLGLMAGTYGISFCVISSNLTPVLYSLCLQYHLKNIMINRYIHLLRLYIGCNSPNLEMQRILNRLWFCQACLCHKVLIMLQFCRWKLIRLSSFNSRRCWGWHGWTDATDYNW